MIKKEMGNASTKQNLRKSQKERLTRETKYTQDELASIHKKFVTDYPSGQITKTEFIKVFERHFQKGKTSASKMADHVFRALDENKNGTIGIEINFHCFIIFDF